MIRIIVAVLALVASLPAIAAGDLATKFSNRGSIANTRHNMTQRAPEGGPSPDVMTTYRNDYGEVCVYCHTPHGASPAQLPLWNRTIEARAYTVYGAGSATLSQTPTAPGMNSLACLSCHDGQTAIDSIINMPGSGGYRAAQATTVSMTFLSGWTNAGPQTHIHLTMQECLACHSTSAGPVLGAGATSFDAFVIGTDLSNDHPVGIKYPTDNPDYREPTALRGNLRFFDGNGNGHAESDEIRLYRTGADGFEVECASCHDPHGVPSAGPGSTFNAGFLRVSNTGSGVCLSCHMK